MLEIEWSGINALLYYGPTLLRAVGLGGDTMTLLVAGGVGIVQALAVLPVIVCIDRLGECFSSDVLEPELTMSRKEAAFAMQVSSSLFGGLS